jgi:hypothetical protein
MSQKSPAGAIKVKRDGPRGWHWIAAANFNPAVHEVVVETVQVSATPYELGERLAQEPKRRGRPPKARELNTKIGA